MISKDVTNENVKSFESESKKSLKGESVDKNIEIRGKNSGEILHNINPSMELAMQFISSDQK